MKTPLWRFTVLQQKQVWTAKTIQTGLHQDLCWTKWQSVHLVENKWYVILCYVHYTVLTSRDSVHIWYWTYDMSNMEVFVTSSLFFCVKLATERKRPPPPKCLWCYSTLADVLLIDWIETPMSDTLTAVIRNVLLLHWIETAKQGWYIGTFGSGIHCNTLAAISIIGCDTLYHIEVYILIHWRLVSIIHCDILAVLYLVIHRRRSTNRGGAMSYAGSQVSAVHCWPTQDINTHLSLHLYLYFYFTLYLYFLCIYIFT